MLLHDQDYDGNDIALPPSPEDPGPRTWRLAAGFAFVLAAAGLLPLDGRTLHAVGYAMASLIAFTFVAMYRRASVRRMELAGIGASDRLTMAAVGVLVLGLAVAVLHAYAIAVTFA